MFERRAVSEMYKIITCGYLSFIPLLILVDVGQILRTDSAPVLATNRRVPVEGVSFSFTCTLDAAISRTTRFLKGTNSVQGGCSSSGSCGTSVSGYTLSLNSTSRIVTLDIASADSTRDSETWTCTDGNTSSNSITLSRFAAVLDWSSVTFSPQLTSLPSSVTPQNTISVTMTTPCAAPAANITWRYQQGVSGVPPITTSSSQGSCPPGQVQTTNTLSLPGNTVSLYKRQVSLTVSVEHDSFDPPTYTKSVSSNTIQFPVPVTSVTPTNISSDNEKIGLVAGQSLTLTCVTSASFPTSTVTWATLPSGTTPTVSTETTSGVLVKTTSSVTFTVSRSDQGRSIRCQAENINGQTSPLSNRATLEVWYAPDITFNPVDITEGQPLTLQCEASGRPASYTFGSFIQYWGNTSVDSRAGTPTGGVYTWSVGAATYLDRGAYECRVDNSVTDRNDVLVQRKRVRVSVKAPPKFTEDSKQIFGAEVGTNTTLVQSFYNSEVNYTSYNWTFGPLDTPVNRSGSVRSRKVTLRKNNKEVQHTGFSVSLDIQNFQKQDIGVYTVTVCNVVGCNSSEVNLTAAGPPLVPLEFMVVNTTLTSVLLRWKSNYPGGDYTQTFLLQYRVEKSGEWKTLEYEDNPGGYVYADVTDLQPGTRYEFKVKARNSREQNNEGPFTRVESQVTKTSSTSDKDSYIGIAAGAGVGGAVLILVLIGGIVLLVKRRRQHGEDGEKHLMKSSGNQKKRDDGNEFVSMENDIYQSGNGASKQENEEAVMQENDIYEGGAAAAAARTGDVCSQVVKPKKPVEKDEEAVYAKTSKEKKAKKEKDKNLEKQKDAEKKKKNKKRKDDKIPLKPKRTQQNRGDVYENTVPGQFGDGTYANAGYLADDGDSAPTEGQKSGRDEDGLLYVSVDFGNARPSTEVHRAEESTEYAGIAFGQVGALPPDEEEAKEEKKK